MQQVYFSVIVPSLSDAEQKETNKLKRFPLELAANIEARMTAVLRECGVVVQGGAEVAPSSAESQPRRGEKRAKRRTDDWRRGRQGGGRRPSGMDFGDFTMGEMYAKADRAAAASSSRRRKKPIHNLKGLLEFMKEEDTMEVQQQRRIAWESIQSVRGMLKRELGVEDVLFSCGWSTMHLNTTVMILLQTLRNNEYRIGLNPADVPLQWVQVLESIDADMVVFMKTARESLASLQSDATAALGEASISRGHTCSALGYRTFLQSMRQRSLDGNSEQGLMEKFKLVVEEESYDWVVLETGEVRAPSTSSYGEAISFLSKSRSLIRRQLETHNANLEAFAYISSRCADAMHVKSITRDEGIPVSEAIVACEELLKAVVGMTPSSSRGSIPQEMVRFLDTYTQGRSICISRTYGLGQDGVFTLPSARSDVKRYASYALRLQQELEREKQSREEEGGDVRGEEPMRFAEFKENYTAPATTSQWDRKVEKTRADHVVWGRKIDRLVQMLGGRGEAAGGERESATRDNQMDESVHNVIQELVPFLRQQRSLIGGLGRENAQLRGMLQARPTRRELQVELSCV
ncbi:unnamed protein product [Phytophthora fragariaefolia]|uniref:Unnamed protein product n=1 Tax=Phytophthora fragariaefolia TaxID=1490495 RepID=A0A9W6Y4L2_9STRA|nr:unnamed protein product [Phytophthora fragariaefolia]